MYYVLTPAELKTATALKKPAEIISELRRRGVLHPFIDKKTGFPRVSASMMDQCQMKPATTKFTGNMEAFK